MKKVVLSSVVAFVFLFVGYALASPPVPYPDQGYVLSTTTDIQCTGTVVERQSFVDTHAYNNDPQVPATIGGGLVPNESIARIAYEEEYRGYNGFTTFDKDFDAKSHPANESNLEVDKVIGFVSNSQLGSVASHNERVAIEVVSAGSDAAGEQFSGLLALCPWSPVGNGFDATNEGIAMGSSFDVAVGGAITSTTHADADVTKYVALKYGVSAEGSDVTVSAGMLASLWEGSERVLAPAVPPVVPALAGRTHYTEDAMASGAYVNFNKEMVYQSVFTEPSPTPDTIDRILLP
jgi:hypothetical protein